MPEEVEECKTFSADCTCGCSLDGLEYRENGQEEECSRCGELFIINIITNNEPTYV